MNLSSLYERSARDDWAGLPNEQKRKRTARLAMAGVRRADAARLLDVAESTIARWADPVRAVEERIRCRRYRTTPENRARKSAREHERKWDAIAAGRRPKLAKTCTCVAPLPVLDLDDDERCSLCGCYMAIATEVPA